MNNFKRVSAAVLAGMTMLLASGSSHGLGFGRPIATPILGETLVVSVPLRLETGEEISNECVAADVYFGDDKVTSSAVSALVSSRNGSDFSVKVSTIALITEPVITVYLAAGCKAKITRKFVAFADPPSFVAASTDLTRESADISHAIDLATMPEQAVLGRPSELSGALTQSRPSRIKQTNSKPGAGLVVGKRATKAASQPNKPSSAMADGAHLALDPVESDAMVIPSLRMAATLAAAAQADDQSPELLQRRQAASALWLAMNASPEQLARDRGRLQELEQRVAQLKQEGEQASGAVAALQTRLTQAETQKGSSKLLMLFAFGALLAVLYLVKQLREQKQQSQSWWQSQQAEVQAQEPVDVDEPDTVRPAPASQPAHVTVAVPRSIHDLVPDTRATSVVVAPEKPAAAITVSHSEPPREVSVEELIDLEQQADFFVVLGQDGAAIDLLDSYVQGTHGASPLPFLKLLEIYRRLGKRSAYEGVQAKFDERFNAHAPGWDTDFQHGHSLGDYPGVVERVQALWSSPIKAMEVLEKSLTRHDAGADTFDLPAYRELLFLYAIARDLSEREVVDRTSVDLLLPVFDISGDEPAPSVHGDSDGPLMATRPIKSMPEARASMSLDLHLDDLEAPVQSHKL
ncbi:MAG: hypothetical protein Q7U28_03030 [Aquabacterium sp.]|nr:hypothetical protein [Aquabacterium sp.]